jgi:probable O-glycosylation ligase (exosortase A-associated)
MPEAWWDRMETIGEYKEDGSALGRINAWHFAWNLASDRLIGGGFSIYSAELFARYSPDPERVHAAHSIYFQALAEHGFPGLLLFLTIGTLTWLDARRLIRMGATHTQLAWAADLGRMTQVSMIGYATGGAFLSLSYWDMPYNIMAIVGCAVFVAQKVAGGRAASNTATTGSGLVARPR